MKLFRRHNRSAPELLPDYPVEDSAPRAARAGHLVWEPPGKGVAILLSLDLASRLERLIQANNGQEIGGVLLGRCDASSDPANRRLIIVDDFDPVESEHSRGSAYVLSRHDKKALDHSLSRSRSNGSLTPVGFFRSHLRKGIYLDEADFTLFHSHFCNPCDVFLIARPASDGPPTAGFFFWEDGALNRREPYAQFPLNREALTHEGYPIERSLSAAALVDPQPPAPAAPPPKPEIPASIQSRSWKRTVYAALGTAMIAGALVLGAVMRFGWPGQGAVGVSLSVERAPDGLHLSWNPNAAAVERADAGILWVTESGKPRRIDLDAQTIKSGSFVYQPQSADVRFRLDLLQVSSQGSESVRYVAEAIPPKPSPVETLSRPRQPEQPDNVAVPPPRTDPESAPAPDPDNDDDSVPPPRWTIAPQPQAPAPAIASEKPHHPAPPLTVAQSPAPASPAKPRLTGTVTVSTRPAAPPKYRKWIAKVPLVSFVARHNYKAGDEFRPARPLHQAPPHLTSKQLHELPGDWTIDLRVTVDSSGAVTEIDLANSSADSRLVDAASRAVQRWHFEPARLRGRAVSSDVIVTVHFHNPPAGATLAERQ